MEGPGQGDLRYLVAEDGERMAFLVEELEFLGVTAWRRSPKLPTGIGAVVRLGSGERLVYSYGMQDYGEWISQQTGDAYPSAALECLDFTVLSEGVPK